jgi:solute carrier family 25 (mitochondrial oxoglutarate transporter), member 11
MGKLGKKLSVSPFQVGKDILANNGIKGLYNGLDSALFRQATYCTARLGLYKVLFDYYTQKNNGQSPAVHEKIICSMVAGSIGAMIGNPSDLALVRFQNDSTLPHDQRRNYKHVFDAFGRIIKEEGPLTLWRGSAPTVARAVLMNVGMLVSYDECKEKISKFRNQKSPDQSTMLISSAISGVICSFMSLPADNLRVKLQRMKKNADGTQPYKGLLDCAVQSIKREGVTGLWIGYPTFYFRVAPHTMITLLTQDFLRHLDSTYISKKK